MKKEPAAVKRARGGAAASATISEAEIAEAPLAAAFGRLETSAGGLTQNEVSNRLANYGLNEIARPRRRNPLATLASNFTHLLALLLWIAALLAFIGNLQALAWAIVAVILINGAFSFAQEYRASQLLEALQRRVRSRCRVRRDGIVEEIDSAGIVPGDVVLLAEGERIPADLRIIASAGLQVDESALTGESLPVLKLAEPQDAAEGGGTRSNLLYSGTLVLQGDAEAIAWATGEHTQFGAISELTASLVQAAGPLQLEIEGLARVTAVIAVTAAIVIWVLSTVVLGRNVSEGFVFAIGVLVALVPEGLLPTLSLALALGVQRMARRNVLVRRLSAIEALGATEIICTDKTGTLTENRMVVERVWFPNGEFAIERSAAGTTLREVRDHCDASEASELLRVAALASNVAIGVNEAGDNIAEGDPTEVAIFEVAQALAIEWDDLRKLELPFDSYRRLMSAVDQEPSGLMLHTKGAPDSVLERCLTASDGESLSARGRHAILAQAENYANAGMRVLGVAQRPLVTVEDNPDRDRLEDGLQFLGLIAMLDPVRPQAADAVARCRRAGMRIVIITGDHPGTAAAVAARVGLTDDEKPQIITGPELSALSPAGLQGALENNVIFARTTPLQKLAIVSALQDMGHTVAVIGDGVNDAPSLRRADVGVAMGKSGTDVAREAADIVLLDDDFGTIVDAVEEGRAIFANIRKFVSYVFTSNVAELAPFAVFVLTGIPLPLMIAQVLAVDLGTDLVPALALGAEPPEPGTLDAPPRARSTALLDRGVFLRTFMLLGPIEALLGLAGYFFVYWTHGWRPGDVMIDAGHVYVLATTMTFVAIVAGQIGNVLACRSFHVSLFAMPPRRNPLLLAALAVEVATLLLLVYVPPFAHVFALTQPGMREWLFVLVLLPRAAAARRAQEAYRDLALTTWPRVPKREDAPVSATRASWFDLACGSCPSARTEGRLSSLPRRSGPPPVSRSWMRAASGRRRRCSSVRYTPWQALRLGAASRPRLSHCVRRLPLRCVRLRPFLAVALPTPRGCRSSDDQHCGSHETLSLSPTGIDLCDSAVRSYSGVGSDAAESSATR